MSHTVSLRDTLPTPYHRKFESMYPSVQQVGRILRTPLPEVAWRALNEPIRPMRTATEMIELGKEQFNFHEANTLIGKMAEEMAKLMYQDESPKSNDTKPIHAPTAAILERIAQVKKCAEHTEYEVKEAEERLARKIEFNKKIQKQVKIDLRQLNRALKLVKNIK